MINHGRLSDGALADFYFSNLDFDPKMAAPDSQAIVAEVTRRGLTTDQLQTATYSGEVAVRRRRGWWWKTLLVGLLLWAATDSRRDLG